MKVMTNLNDFEKALRDNFKGVTNKKYIKDSIAWHMSHKYITPDQATKLEKEYL